MEIKSPRKEQNKLWVEVRRLRSNVRSLGKAVSRTLEYYTSAFIEMILEERGYPKEKINIRKETLVYGEERLETNIFNEDPLAIGEVTTYTENREKAPEEVKRVLDHIKAAEKTYKKKATISILSVANPQQKQ